jgi:glutamate carboxypeptidase
MEMDNLRSRLEQRFSYHLDLLGEWVGINTHSANAEGVGTLGRQTAEVFASLGFTPAFLPSAHPWAGQHVVLTRPGRSERVVALVSHLDTVFTPEEERSNDFRFRIEGDRVYGPGTCDIKGGTLTALMTLDALRTVVPDLFETITWVVGLNALEERLDHEFTDLLRTHLTGQVLAVLVFEAGSPWPGQWPLVVARKGRVEFHIDVEGRGAHAGTDFWSGRNALLDAARLALDVAAVSSRERDRTVNVGRLHGGTETNRVPHAAFLDVEMRTFVDEYLDEGLERVREIVESLNASGGRATLSVTERLRGWPRNPGTEHLFSIWQKAGKELGMEVVPQERGGLSDGSLLWADYPTLDGLGPVGANDHCSERSADGSKDQEYAVLSSFVPKALLTCAGLLRLAHS